MNVLRGNQNDQSHNKRSPDIWILFFVTCVKRGKKRPLHRPARLRRTYLCILSLARPQPFKEAATRAELKNDQNRDLFSTMLPDETTYLTGGSACKGSRTEQMRRSGLRTQKKTGCNRPQPKQTANRIKVRYDVPLVCKPRQALQCWGDETASLLSPPEGSLLCSCSCSRASAT